MKSIAKYFRAVWMVIAAMVLCGCREVPDYHDDALGNFDALAEIVGDRYCFFEEKNIDWDELCRVYRSKINSETKQGDLFVVMSELLDELEDGHVNLISPFTTSYYKKWWSDYPQDFNSRTLQQYYLNFQGWQTCGITYGIFSEDVGYMYYPSFSSAIGDTNLDYILAILSDTKGLIIDIRNNGGGMLTNVDKLVSRFIDKKICGGYIRHKTGPGHNDFSEPFAIEYKPATGRVQYLKPIIVLTNRSCFSAANNFVAVMKTLPNVAICGARTGGGGGLPFSSELPNGWGIRFSACPITDPNDCTTEFGIDPSPGYEVHDTDEELAAGQDNILDFAIERIRQLPSPEKE